MYRPSVSFTQRANNKAWCKTHPTAFIGKNQRGDWYKTCVWGHKEELAGNIPGCEIVIEGGEKNE